MFGFTLNREKKGEDGELATKVILFQKLGGVIN
jgi:hypothetical protein